jgi:hypothetical protein
MCRATSRQPGLVTAVPKPISEAGRRKEFIILGGEERQMDARRRVENALQLGVNVELKYSSDL